MTSALPLTGGCQCGACRYELWDAPETIYCCHCSECRRQSASAFGISVIVRTGTMRLIQGAPRSWTRPTAAGDVLDCRFCPDCGTRLWHQGANQPDFRSVKGGTLDDPPDLSQVVHIHTDTMLKGVVLPHGVTTFAEEPPDR